METKSKISILRIIVADCTKNHCVIGIKILKVNATILLNNVKPIVQGRLVNYEAIILIKSGVQSSYFKYRPFSIHIQPLVIQKAQ